MAKDIEDMTEAELRAYIERLRAERRATKGPTKGKPRTRAPRDEATLLKDVPNVINLDEA